MSRRKSGKKALDFSRKGDGWGVLGVADSLQT